MAVRTAEEKDAIIASRGESSVSGSDASCYKVNFYGGKSCYMICMNKETLIDAASSCLDRFGPKFLNVEAF